jgi:hypothetical protein
MSAYIIANVTGACGKKRWWRVIEVISGVTVLGIWFLKTPLVSIPRKNLSLETAGVRVLAYFHSGAPLYRCRDFWPIVVRERVILTRAMLNSGDMMHEGAGHLVRECPPPPVVLHRGLIPLLRLFGIKSVLPATLANIPA